MQIILSYSKDHERETMSRKNVQKKNSSGFSCHDNNDSAGQATLALCRYTVDTRFNDDSGSDIAIVKRAHACLTGHLPD